LPDSFRQLRDGDFWDGLRRPLSREDRISISIDFAEFEDNADYVASLGGHLIETEPMVARLTYVFQPLSTIEGDPTKESDYEFFIYGDDNPENKLTRDIRRRLPLDVLPALRDAENDLTNWRRSPLRPLLDEVSSGIERGDIEEIARRG
jgi:putative ATP-dependent endonuclease of OLD family